MVTEPQDEPVALTIVDEAPGAERAVKPLDSLERLGDGSMLVDQLHALMGRSRFFADFTRDDMDFLAQSLEAYRAQPGQTIIREGDVDDYVLFVLAGHVQVAMQGREGSPRTLRVVGPGVTLGEMSMIDGEPRSASCVAVDTVTVAVLRRDAMVRILLEEPAIGAKILIKFVTMLSARLRQTGVNQFLHD